MAILVQAQQAEFARLKELTSTSDSVMSKHLSALADAGLIKLTKANANGRPRSPGFASPAPAAEIFHNHVAALQRIVRRQAAPAADGRPAVPKIVQICKRAPAMTGNVRERDLVPRKMKQSMALTDALPKHRSGSLNPRQLFVTLPDLTGCIGDCAPTVERFGPVLVSESLT